MAFWAIIDVATSRVIGQAETNVGRTPADEGWAVDGSVTIARRTGRRGDLDIETFDLDSGEWAPNIPALKARRWAQIRAARDRAEWAGCATPYGRADTDPDSQRKIGGAVQMAMIAQAAGQPFAIEWTMQDNRTLPHDAAAMIALGVAVGGHVAACHELAVARRAAIDAADSVAAIDAVDADDGWPDAPVSGENE